MYCFKLVIKHGCEIAACYGLLTALECGDGHLMDQGWLVLLFNLLLVPLAVLDFHYGRLFNGLVLLLGLVGLGVTGLVTAGSMIDGLYGAAVFGGILFLIRYASRGKLGAGDVKFGWAAGLWLGVQASVVALYLSFILGALAAIGYFIRVKLEGRGEGLWAIRKSTIPFGPCLSLGSSLALMQGEMIMKAYLDLFQASQDTVWWS